MSTPLDDRPFVYTVSPDMGIKTPSSLPLIVVRKIYKMMEKDNLQTLKERYVKAFKIAVTDYVKMHYIIARDSTITLTGEGVRKEVKATAKSDSIAINIKFKQWMDKLNQDAIAAANLTG